MRERNHNTDQGPSEVDTTRASAARIYDYLLGGSHNFAVDREAAEAVLAVLPEACTFARQNRAFLRRVVQYGIEHGIRQFLDLGSGLPTVGNVHETAQARVPDARVVYVDNEPVAVEHSLGILGDNPYATCIHADITDTQSVLTHPETLRLLDFTQPLMVLMCAVLHFVPDDRQPDRVVREYADALAPDSYLALTHATPTDYPEQMAEVVAIYEQTQNSAHLRTRAQITGLLAPLPLFVYPGVVYTSEWQPEHPAEVGDPARSLAFGALAYLPLTRAHSGPALPEHCRQAPGMDPM
ncbi:SAM-dependent methyltransferase [Kutzneria sp. 744]|uniref:SAM-dependent methyltransferase n=1 Tax=Kutzneria sp. (strain 744) TaxID=345341 RepID=UPI0007C5A857|nr:SAM-dependent methyltransferase [Kutzneria sp. 744]